MAMWKPGTKAPGLSIERISDEKRDVVVNKMAHLPLTTQRQRLPIYSNRLHILYLLENYRTVIVVGETGCGKSTQIPQYLFEAGWADGGRVVACTQPRRVAAQTLAARVAEEMGVELGKECGYTIRFDNKADAERTRVKFLTDGILLREMMGDPLLSRYSVIMVDEAHERSIYTDVVVGLLKKVQRRRKDLRVIVSSATLNADEFKSFFLGDKVDAQPPFRDGTLGRVSVMSMEAGRMYPVDVHYMSEPTQDYLKSCLETVLQIHMREPPGDILVFLTGADEVMSLTQTIHELGGKGWQGLTLTATPLFGALDFDRQLEAFGDTSPGTRKVVIATNIAETSVTIPGIVYVIDCMFVKMRSYNAKLGIDMLTVMPVSKASATQRAGRAGRVKAGKCYRVCTEDVFISQLCEMTIPEMQRAELTSVVLQLKALGIDDVLHFDFPSPPPALTLARALEILYALGAVDDDAKLAEPLGVQLAEFPLDPMLAKFLLSSGQAGCSEEALSIAAMLSVPHVFLSDSLSDEKSARHHYAVKEGDHLTLLNVYNAFEAAKRNPQWSAARHVNHRSMKHACETRKQLANYISKLEIPLVSCGRDSRTLRRTITAAFFCNAAKLEADGSYRTIRGQQLVHVHPLSVLHQHPSAWVLFNELTLSTKPYILGVLQIEPQWLSELAPHFYKFKGAKGTDVKGVGGLGEEASGAPSRKQQRRA